MRGLLVCAAGACATALTAEARLQLIAGVPPDAAFAARFRPFRAPRGGPSRRSAAAVVQVADMLDAFKIDVSDFTKAVAVERHSGACGGPPEVEIIRTGQDGIFAGRGTLRVPAPAQEVFERLTDPEENKRIFARTCAAVNYRDLVDLDEEKRQRLFEVSKTGRWRLFGIPLTFESTVYALEDWRLLEIRFRLKKPGAMRHLSGMWRVFPIGARESLVVFYNEAVPSVPLPGLVTKFASRAVRDMAGSLLEDLRGSSSSWATDGWTPSERAPGAPE